MADTVQILQSHLSGQWIEGDGLGSELVNPTTEAVVARTATRGLDLAGALVYARQTGGAALRALTFAQRGALLAAMSKAIHAQRETLIDLAVANGGNTRGDAKFDIDGATGTLMAYAQLAETLGDARVLHDGEPINLGRSARIQGRHVLTPKHGVAVHINAFNFPAWGLGEKAACALLAGMPVLCKPATSTAVVTWQVVRAIDEAGVLPPGVLSLLCGGVGDLLDHVGWQDVIAFTGSADTGLRIRQHARVLEAGVPVNVEADSLNSAVLVPDADDATYDAFIRDVHRDMTQKTGQKCTAIRRILVPEDRVAEVIEDLGERLTRTRVGDPSVDGIGMGPVATAGQLRAAREGIDLLLGQTDVAWGDPKRAEFEHVAPGTGYFVSPLLLTARDAHRADVVHNHEVFGPVATILPYDGKVETAAALVRRGGGSLVASVYGDDRKFLESTILALAPWHGRLYIVDGRIADKGFGPGAVLPQLLHGGPGRAGGGEELGGLRGMRVYSQRCAVQGNGPLIARMLGAPE